MKKNLLFRLMLLVTGLLLGANLVWADTGTLILTFKAPVGEQVSLTFGVWDTEDEYSVDFGDGTLQTAKVGVNNSGPVDPETGQTTGATVFTGTVSGDGTIKVYGNNDVWYLLVSGGAMPTTLDQAKLMNVVQMSITGADAESVTLPAYPQMTQFSFNNSPLRTIDVSKVATLTSLTVNNTTSAATQLESIDVSNNTELTYLSLQGNANSYGKLTSLDLSKNTKLENIMVQYNALTDVTLGEYYPTGTVNFSCNQLTVFDGTFGKNSGYFDVSGNQLTALDLSEQVKKGNIKVQNNFFTIATLPAKPAVTSASKYTYAPQPAYVVEESLTELDLSSQLMAVGVGTEPVETTYSFVTESGTLLVEGTDYEVTEPGKFRFIKAQAEKVHGIMETQAFPKFTGANAYVTTEFTVVPDETTPTPILRLTAPAGNEVSLTFGVWDTEDEYSVDFGDGTLQTAKVGVSNAGPVDPETGQTTGATVFTGTVSGDGTIKVYGNNDVWYLLVSGGAMPTTLDQAKLMNVVQMSITGADAESVTLPAYPQMTQFSFNNSPLRTIDVSKVATLTSLTVNNTTSAATQLESIDVSNNTELTYLSLQGNANSYGKLTSLDLSKNTKLENIMVQYNALTDVTLGEYYPTGTVNFSCNQLTVFDGTFGKNSGYFDVSGNQLTALDLSEQVKKGNIKVQNNLFTLATLPAKPAVTSASKYTYAPQPAYVVEESLTELDLSSQLMTVGVGTEPVETSYSFVTESGTPLVEGTDYEVIEPGKFRFIKAQAEKVHGIMETQAFPKFTGANAYVTTEFTIVPYSGISYVDADQLQNGKYYNLQGVEIQKPIKGVYIQNGRKVVVK